MILEIILWFLLSILAIFFLAVIIIPIAVCLMIIAFGISIILYILIILPISFIGEAIASMFKANKK